VKPDANNVLRVVWSDAAKKKLTEVTGYVLTSAIALGAPPPGCPVQSLGAALAKFYATLEPKKDEAKPTDAKEK
jgi:hypothetical protein